MAEEQRVGPEAKRVELLMDQLRVIKNRFDHKGELLKLIAEMGARTPAAVHWKSMSYVIRHPKSEKVFHSQSIVLYFLFFVNEECCDLFRSSFEHLTH